MLVRHRTYTPAFDRSIDRAFEQLTNSFFDTIRSTGPVVDGAWIDDEYVLTVDLPGVPADAVTVEVTGTTLTLGATTDTLDWKRSVRLGGRLDPDKVRARHIDGRLTVRVGTVDQPEARTIPIETTAPERAITASSVEGGNVAIDMSTDDTVDMEVGTEADMETVGAQSTDTNETE
jgi:HSP20 family protein